MSLFKAGLVFHFFIEHEVGEILLVPLILCRAFQIMETANMILLGNSKIRSTEHPYILSKQ